MSFIFVGRLEALKGIEVLFEAWKLMADDAPGLIVCGRGPLDNWCRQHSQGLRIEMKGYVENSTLRKLISQSSALILPTLLYEGFPMTIVEAFSVGTPVICSDIGNAGSLVEDGVTGWKFEPGSAEGLIEAVKKCLETDETICNNVRCAYLEKYTPEANYSLLADIYTEVQHANRSAGS